MPDDPLQPIIAAANPILQTIAPLLGPYGPPLILGLAILQKVEPTLFAEIAGILESIHNGGAVSDADQARLNGLIVSLKEPGGYFE